MTSKLPLPSYKIEARAASSLPILRPAPPAASISASDEPEPITKVLSTIFTSVESTDTVVPCTKRLPATVTSESKVASPVTSRVPARSMLS